MPCVLMCLQVERLVHAVQTERDERGMCDASSRRVRKCSCLESIEMQTDQWAEPHNRSHLDKSDRLVSPTRLQGRPRLCGKDYCSSSKGGLKRMWIAAQSERLAQRANDELQVQYEMQRRSPT